MTELINNLVQDGTLSSMFQKLYQSGDFQTAIWVTIYMTLLSAAVAYVIGLPLGVILSVTDNENLIPHTRFAQDICRIINSVLGVIVNALRSIPFIILMVAMLPVAKKIVGTSLGTKAMIVMLIIAAAPYVARMVESSIKEVDAGVIEAAKAMGTPTRKIILKVLIPEAKPALIVGAVISTVTILGYSAMAGTISGGGLGQIAIMNGYQRSNNDIIWICVVITVIIVQVIQVIGMWIARKTDKRINK